MKELCEIIVEEVLEQREESSYGMVCGLGRLKTAEEGGKYGKEAVSVLFKVPHNTCVPTIVAPREDCIIIPSGVGRELIPLIPSLVFGLWAWDKLSLELGDAAVFSGSTLNSRIVGQLALWSGACPVISLHNSNNPLNGIEYPEGGILIDDELLGWLRQKLNGRSRVAAIDMDGRGGVVDIFLEALPRWGRLMLAGNAKEPVTIDYYNNIHRKGALIFSIRFEPTMIFENSKWPIVGEHLRRAFRILQNGKMAKELLTLSQKITRHNVIPARSGVLENRLDSRSSRE